MFIKYFIRSSVFFLIATLSSCALFESSKKIKEPTALSQSDREELKKPIHLQDLAYGDILYDYYRGHEISALTKILIAKKENQLSHHKNNAELLAGVLYLNLGMVIKAKSIFKKLLTEEDLKNELLAKLDFYLGKLHYKQHDYKNSELRLTRIYPFLDIELQNESFIMLANISLFNKKLDKARYWLSQVSIDSDLLFFSRYNLGIIWLTEERLSDALPLLTKVFLTNKPTDLQRSLQDKAKVALGFYYLKHKQLDQAREVFLSVRLDSPSTNKALLGMGWTYVEQENYNKALSHWLELMKKDIRDIAVQEALLAIPYAYQKLHAMKPALKHYLNASNLFQQQLDLVRDIEAKVTNGNLVEKLIINMVNYKKRGHENKIIQDSKLFGKDYDYYIYELLAQNKFNENFRSYQKLDRLELLLIHWQAQLPMLNEMLRTNQLRFDEKIPQVDYYLKQGQLTKYQKLFDKTQEDISSLKNHEKLYLIANKQQLLIHKRILRLESKLKNIPEAMLKDNQLETSRRARGVLQWQLETNLTNNIWQLKKTSLLLQKQLIEMKKLSFNLSNARGFALTRFIGAQEQVNEGVIILANLRKRINNSVNQEAENIKKQILSVLEQRKKTLEYFLLQSDLSVARLHEQAVSIPEVQ